MAIFEQEALARVPALTMEAGMPTPNFCMDQKLCCLMQMLQWNLVKPSLNRQLELVNSKVVEMA